MTDRPSGFGPPDDSGRDPDRPGGSGGGDQPPRPAGPFGPLGDPQQFADALRQFADMMSWQGGPVNWDLAKNVARHTVAAHGDPSVVAAQRQEVNEALRLADLWLEDATTFPSGIHSIEAWSRAEWVEATFPVWSKLCEPVAVKAVEGMGGIASIDPTQFGAVPDELRSALGALGGGLGGLAAMMKQVGGAMIGGQVGSAVGELAQQVVGSADIGLPLGPDGTAALLPAGVADFSAGLSVDAGEVRLFLALREAAHHRLFAHVPWLRSYLFGALEQYARGMTVDTTRLQEALPQIDMTNPEALREALASGDLLRPDNTDEQKAALARLETALALVEGWVACVVADAAARRLPHAEALAETVRRRRATGGPAEQTFANLVGLELRPRRLREAAAIWRDLTAVRGIEGRDGVWAHRDLIPTAEDLDDPAGFVSGRPDIDITDIDASGGSDPNAGGAGGSDPNAGGGPDNTADGGPDSAADRDTGSDDES